MLRKAIFVVLPLFLFQGAFAQTIQIPYFENFDSTTLYWYSSSSGSANWQLGPPNGTVIDTAWSGPNAWKTNLVPGNPSAPIIELYSPVFNLASSGLGPNDLLTLSFRHWIAMQSSEYGHVQYSTDGGLIWLGLGYIGDPLGMNWYTTNLGGNHCFTNTNSGWQFSSYQIFSSLYSCSSFQLRFRFSGNLNSTSDGWAIDDFSLTVLPPNSSVTIVNIPYPTNDTLPGTLLNATVMIRNLGILSQTSIPVDLRINGLPYFLETWTGLLMPGDSTIFTFNTPYVVPSGPYTLCAYTNLGGSINGSYCRNFAGVSSPNGSVGGWITNPFAGASMVYLIVQDTANATLTAIDTTLGVIALYGSLYSFTNIPPGDYLVKAALLPSNPGYPTTLPTYHQSAIFWNQATTVSVSPNTITSADINMVQGVNPGGPGFVGGLISQGANKGTGDPIEGVLVMLLDANNADQPISFTYSDNAGHFELSNIPFGTYKVYAEMLNKTTYPTLVTLDAVNPSTQGIQIVVGSTVISSLQDLTESNAQLGPIYPNPATGLCYIQVDDMRGSSPVVSISDITGKHVRKFVFDMSNGSIQICIDAASLDAGIYQVSISSSEGVEAVRKLVKQ